MTRFSYATPSCEYDNYFEATALLAGSDLTDDGAGEFITSGGEFEFYTLHSDEKVILYPHGHRRCSSGSLPAQGRG